MQKWEYSELSGKYLDKMMERANLEGAEGWEMYGTICHDGQWIFIYKRPLE